MALAALMTFSSQVMAQAFEGKGSKQLLIGVGLNQHTGYFGNTGVGFRGAYSPTSVGLNVQMEWGIHQYVGLGFFAGTEGFSNYRGGVYGGYYVYPGNPGNPGNPGPGYLGYYGASSYRGMAIPVGFHANFHFLQLIADKTGKDFADKLDVYAGLSIGGGAMFVFPSTATQNYYPAGTKLNRSGPMFYGGGHLGIRFYPKSNFGIFAEVGYGKSIVQGGIALKL